MIINKLSMDNKPEIAFSELTEFDFAKLTENNRKKVKNTYLKMIKNLNIVYQENMLNELDEMNNKNLNKHINKVYLSL